MCFAIPMLANSFPMKKPDANWQLACGQVYNMPWAQCVEAVEMGMFVVHLRVQHDDTYLVIQSDLVRMVKGPLLRG